VLPVVLLLLLVLTVLGTSGAVTATLTLQQSSGARAQARAAAAAEYAIAQAIALPGLDFGATPAAPMRPACGSGCRVPTTGDRYRYAMHYDSSAGATPAPGSDPASATVAHHFIVQAVGEAGRGARVELERHFYVLEPGGTRHPTVWRQAGAE
jgi:type II secretory pathway pseudopilin PulG